MYNEERKRRYLEEKGSKTFMSNNLQNAMALAEQKEIEADRDMCEWTADEIVEFFKYYSSNSVQTLVQLKNSIEQYTDWCQIHGFVSDNQNHWRDITTDILCGCINFTEFAKQIVFRADFIKQVRSLPNYRDQFIMLGLYEGIKLKYLCDVKLSDLIQDVLVLPYGHMTISRDLVNIMHNADQEEVCVAMRESKTDKGEAKYLPGDTIVRDNEGLRKTKIVRTKDPTVLVGQRIRLCNQFLDTSYTIKSIQESGRIQMIKDLSNQFNVAPDKCITDPEIRAIHEYRFGKIQNLKTYLLTYGKVAEIDYNY